MPVAVHGTQPCRESALPSADHSEYFSVSHGAGRWVQICTRRWLHRGLHPERSVSAAMDRDDAECCFRRGWIQGPKQPRASFFYLQRQALSTVLRNSSPRLLHPNVSTLADHSFNTTDPGKTDRPCLGYILKAVAVGDAEEWEVVIGYPWSHDHHWASPGMVSLHWVERRQRSLQPKLMEEYSSTESWGPLSAGTGLGGGLERGQRAIGRGRTEGPAAEEGAGKACRQRGPGYSLH